MIKLSHSSINRYLDCPRSYYFHYIQNYRSKFKSSALFFGTAVDQAVGNLLEGMLEVKPEGWVKRDTFTVFDEVWTKQTHNEEDLSLKESPILRYANADFDAELLQPEDGITSIELDRYKKIRDKKDHVGYDNLKDDDLVFFNKVNWLCLRRKGHIMIKGFIKDFLPRIKKVRAVQKEIRLEDEDSYITGFIDVICDIDTVGNTYIIDLKTSARDYEDDAVLKSQQLSIYAEAEGIYQVGFVVLKKQIVKLRNKVCSVCGFKAPSGSRFKSCDATVDGKRCNGEWNETLYCKAAIQVLMDTITTQQTDMYLQNGLEVSKAIKSCIYVKNFSNCVKPYGKCDFYNLCHNNQDDGTLTKKVDTPPKP